MNNEIKQIIQEFELFTDWEDRYSYIIDLGKKLPSLSTLEKIDANKVDGCVSQVWLTTNQKDNKYYFSADSDAIIVKGLLAIILRIFSGQTKTQILDAGFQELFKALNLETHLTPSRSNGMFAVVEKIKDIVSKQ
ncbi:SufE family protein [Candidatus Bandiella euplotis]|uniref:Cysteine desulfuration protein SufE n=1 Tax=Candidatus Bandiella euplotis TaxID=1664265 RepID=A0ABZ0UJI1_9RICK|nr:SufE family protein [Candidatus Bandiella woodruffii]WPX96264.1 Cysteine desulfuration protein SufE [Candidatus Bandiella woodruffii]